MEFPKNLKYTKDHEWIRVEGSIGTIGITEYAQGELGDIVFVELPAKGRMVKQGETFGTIEAVKAVSDLFAPVTGEVVDRNPALEKTPELVNNDPYQAGWMMKVRITTESELPGLLDEAAYRKLIGK